eukprot:Platyproteum_vivax@DN7093_c0_g1_i1.p1
MVRKIMQQIDTEKQKMEKASEGDLDGFQRATKSMAAMITLVKLLGEGGTASVYKCELSGEGVKPVALKVMKNSRCEDCAHAVHKYMQHVHHPNICGVRRVRKTKYGTCVEMELMRGPQIMAWKDSPKHKFNISTAQHIMKDLLSGNGGERGRTLCSLKGTASSSSTSSWRPEVGQLSLQSTASWSRRPISSGRIKCT